MKLYHLQRITIFAVLLLPFLIGCTEQQVEITQFNVTVIADGNEYKVSIPDGSTVNDAINKLSIELSPLDRVEPSSYSQITDGQTIKVIRVTEKFETKQEIIPFTQQTVRNESLSKDYEVIIQAGSNGLQEKTFRYLFENGKEISNIPIEISTKIIKKPVPEIRMVGIQSPYSSIQFPGKIYYLQNGNIWVMNNSTGDRKPLLTSSDLDGRIFTISNDGTFLLFTRESNDSDSLNQLWVLPTAIDNEDSDDMNEPINLNISNIIHFADFVPNTNTKIVFSTVEPRLAAPGWQANNDLNVITFSTSGWTTDWDVIIEPNSGGVYGWWGTDFLWEPNSHIIGYAEPDSIGIIDYDQGTKEKLTSITPYKVTGNWAWVPGISWGINGHLFFTNHNSNPESPQKEESPLFDISAINITQKNVRKIIPDTGMFAYPIVSIQKDRNGNITEKLAYLQAITATQSDTSHYRVAISDTDGSKNQTIFPADELVGLQPTRNWGVWSPAPLPKDNHYYLAVLYKGNIWFIDTETNEFSQITSGGQITNIIWH